MRTMGTIRASRANSDAANKCNIKVNMGNEKIVLLLLQLKMKATAAIVSSAFLMVSLSIAFSRRRCCRHLSPHYRELQRQSANIMTSRTFMLATKRGNGKWEMRKAKRVMVKGECVKGAGKIILIYFHSYRKMKSKKYKKRTERKNWSFEARCAGSGARQK